MRAKRERPGLPENVKSAYGRLDMCAEIAPGPPIFYRPPGRCAPALRSVVAAMPPKAKAAKGADDDGGAAEQGWSRPQDVTRRRADPTPASGRRTMARRAVALPRAQQEWPSSAPTA